MAISIVMTVFRLNRDPMLQSAHQLKPPCIMLSGHITEELHLLAINVGIYDAIDKSQLATLLLERSIRYILRFHKIYRYLQDAKKTQPQPVLKSSRGLAEVIC